MGEQAALVRTFSVGHRLVTLTLPPPTKGKAGCMVVEWWPDQPPRLSRRELRQYRAGRDAAIREMGRRLGGKAAVVEI